MANHVPPKELALRKAVLKGDTGDIITALENGADPNFIAKSVPGKVVFGGGVSFLSIFDEPLETRPEGVKTVSQCV